MNDIFFRMARLPYHIRAFVLEDTEGDYTVTLNDHLSDEALHRAVKHELAHIHNGDVESEEHFSALEKRPFGG
jgi:hypothetical protein